MHVFSIVRSFLIVITLPLVAVEEELVLFPRLHSLRYVKVFIIKSMRTFYVSLHIFEPWWNGFDLHTILLCELCVLSGFEIVSQPVIAR